MFEFGCTKSKISKIIQNFEILKEFTQWFVIISKITQNSENLKFRDPKGIYLRICIGVMAKNWSFSGIFRIFLVFKHLFKNRKIQKTTKNWRIFNIFLFSHIFDNFFIFYILFFTFFCIQFFSFFSHFWNYL